MEDEVITAGQGLEDAWYGMRDVHEALLTLAPMIPTMQTDDLVERRADWIQEEVDELLEAVDIVEQADAYLDIIVFAMGGLVELGINPGSLYSIVLQSQFDKLWEDGKPRFREDGKWIKPPNWTDPGPLLKEEIERQINEN